MYGQPSGWNITQVSFTKKIATFDSNTNFRLRNRECVKSVKFVKIPSLDGGREVFIETDVIDEDFTPVA